MSMNLSLFSPCPVCRTNSVLCDAHLREMWCGVCGIHFPIRYATTVEQDMEQARTKHEQERLAALMP